MKACRKKVLLLSFIGLLLSFNSFSMFTGQDESRANYNHVKQALKALEELLHKRRVRVLFCILHTLREIWRPLIGFTTYLCGKIRKHTEREIFDRIARLIVDRVWNFVGMPRN